MSALYSHKVTVGDLLYPISRILTKDGKPIDLASLTVKFEMVNDAGTSVITATATGISKQPTSTFTAAATDLLTCVEHVVREGDEIVVSNSGGALPEGLSASTRYFARDVTSNAFKLSATPGGAVVDVTGAGTGTHSFYVVGHVQYAFSSGGVATAGIYWGWFTLLDGSSNKQHVPQDGRTFKVEVIAAA